MSRLAWLAVPALALLMAACGGTSAKSASGGQGGTVTVFAAASLTDAFQELGDRFQADHPGVKVVFNFGGSPTLRTQIEQGAKADVFASADQTQMDLARKDGLLAGDAQRG